MCLALSLCLAFVRNMKYYGWEIPILKLQCTEFKRRHGFARRGSSEYVEAPFLAEDKEITVRAQASFDH